jgi:hypothetical protein
MKADVLAFCGRSPLKGALYLHACMLVYKNADKMSSNGACTSADELIALMGWRDIIFQ